MTCIHEITEHIPTVDFLYPQTFDLKKLSDNLVKNGYFYCNHILPTPIIKGLCHTIIHLEKDNQFIQAQIGTGKQRIIHEQIRKNKTFWINGDNEHEDAFLTFLDTVRLHLNRTLFLGLSDIEAHYALYSAGDFYARHLDSFTTQKSRIISCVIYLNKNWNPQNGGLLTLFKDTTQEHPFAQITPEYNHGIFFLSEEIPHEVTVCHKDRHSIACWFKM